ncbi:MAG TPA: FHA domain-containing protein [Polyangiaceae bacterium]|nr:FHA domain-containing protein [Polyangiaceae bacterium]
MARFSEDECTQAGDIPSRRSQRLPRRIPSLEQIRGPGSPHSYPVKSRSLLIGRSEQTDISIESATLSRHHLRLLERDGEYSFVDLDSANGVYLNGVLAHAAVLRDGDVLEFGEVAFIFHERGQ